MSGRSADYQVGYGRPPQHARFRKGQSGNPKGRPKGSRSFAGIAFQVLNERIVIKENGERRTITKFQAALKQLANKAASGDAHAIREVLKLRASLARESRPEDIGEPQPTAPQDIDPHRIARALLAVLHSRRAAPSPAEEQGSSGHASEPEK